jgi:hypothetical protein
MVLVLSSRGRQSHTSGGIRPGSDRARPIGWGISAVGTSNKYAHAEERRATAPIEAQIGQFRQQPGAPVTLGRSLRLRSESAPPNPGVLGLAGLLRMEPQNSETLLHQDLKKVCSSPPQGEIDGFQRSTGQQRHPPRCKAGRNSGANNICS